jgi:hypothetical protein
MKIALIAMLILSFCVFADTVVQRIEEDQNLTVDQKALYLVYSVIDQTRLPMEYTVGTESVPCGFPALHEAMILSSQVSQSTLEQILALANRPVLSGSPVSFVSPSGHFRVHYTTTGYDATTVEYANDVAEYMDYSWEIECDSMGYFVPPPDGGVGGDVLYDVYVATLTGGTLGYTSCSGEYKPPDSTHSSSASHIVMGAGLSDNYNKSTCTHEFMHAVEMSYDYMEPTWFMENCSVWMESNLYPEINWNGWYSEGAIRAPYKGINSGNPYWYGASFWPRMMGLMFGADAVKEVWENCAATIGANMWDAQEDMFTNHGTNFEQGFMEYGVWRFFVGSYYNPAFDMYAAEAASWGNCLILPWHSFTAFPASGTHGTNPDYFLDTKGIAWIRFKLEDYQGGWAQFNFDGRDGYEWNLGAILFNGESFQFNWYNCDPSTGEASVSFPTAGWDFAVFFPAFMSESSVTASYAFTASYTTGIEEGEPVIAAELSIGSNPMVTGSVVSFTVPSTGNADLSVVDMTGRTVSTLFNGVAEQGLHTVEFDGDLASGTYFVVLRHGTSVQASRVSVLR